MNLESSRRRWDDQPEGLAVAAVRHMRILFAAREHLLLRKGTLYRKALHIVDVARTDGIKCYV